MQKRLGLTAGLYGVMALGLCLFSTGQAQAASGNGPYYATPSWDQKLPAATRFVVLTDWNSEAVLDRETGLVWERAPSGITELWATAFTNCLNKVVGGRAGWRLPTVVELRSVQDLTLPAPLVPSTVFTGVQSANYWSVTSQAATPTAAWLVFFGNGFVGNFNKTTPALTWCVRGGGATGDIQ